MQSKDRDILHSILVVSCSEQFNDALRHSLPEGLFVSLDFRKNAAAARRQILERYYNIVVINVPLPDENGLEFAMDIAEKGNTSVLIAAPSEIYDNVLEYITDYGILAVPKPAPETRIGMAIRLLISIQNKIRGLEQENDAIHERMEELRAVNKAKFLLMEKKHMTEDEAHRFIGKQAMNNGVSRRRIAEDIIEDYETI